MSLTDREVRERVARIDILLERLEGVTDATARDAALAAVQALSDLYGEGLARVVQHVGETCDDVVGGQLADAFVSDELLSHLLLLHGLHPDDLQHRVEQALVSVRPYLESHGGNVELVAIDGGVARLRLSGSCHGCSSSELTLRTMVEDAVRAAAPELNGIEQDEKAAAATADVSALVPLRRRGRSRSESRAQPQTLVAP